MNDIYQLTVRVYGVHINADRQVLVSDEYIAGRMFTKFPGGGLELGEGLKDCLMRECREELFAEVEVKEHLYTTDFFQPSAFRKGDQIISVYYRFDPRHSLDLPFRESPFDFDELVEAAQVFRWIDLDYFTPDDVTFPIDKVVAKIIAKHES